METPLSIKEPIRNRKNPASTWHEQPGIWPFVHSQFLSLNMVTYLRRHIQQTTVSGVLLIWEAKQNRGHKAQEEERTDFVCICMCVYIYISICIKTSQSPTVGTLSMYISNMSATRLKLKLPIYNGYST